MLSLVLSFVVSFVVSLVDSLVLHLPKPDFLDLKVQVLEQLAEYELIVSDRFGVRLIEVDPDLDAVADWERNLRGDESKAIHLFTLLKSTANEFEGEVLVNVLFIGLAFWDLENESSSFLVLLIFPFGFDAFAEEFDGVDFFEGAFDLVAG